MATTTLYTAGSRLKAIRLKNPGNAFIETPLQQKSLTSDRIVRILKPGTYQTLRPKLACRCLYIQISETIKPVCVMIGTSGYNIIRRTTRFIDCWALLCRASVSLKC